MVSYAPELVELGHLLLAYSVGKAKSVALEESIATKTLWAAKMDYLNRVLHNLKMASYRRQIRKSPLKRLLNAHHSPIPLRKYALVHTGAR